ncbi:MAG TPA: HlyD family secretion protein [Candidatus Binataceae bacterium]
MSSVIREDLESRIDHLREQQRLLLEELATLRDQPDSPAALAADGNANDARESRRNSAPPSSRPGSFFRHIAVRLAAVILAVLMVGAGTQFWKYLDSYESTDDAQIDGHIAPVSSRIDGTIAHVYVQDTDSVQAGQPLADIDPRDWQIAVENARGNLAQAIAQVSSARAAYLAAISKIRQSEASDSKAQKDVERYKALFEQHVASLDEYEEKTRAATVDAAVTESDRATAKAAETLITSREAAVSSAKAVLDQALLNLAYTRITASMSGVIGEKTLEVGERVQPGQQLMAIVPLDEIWVTANFKETQIRRMHPGQRATIYVDALGRGYDGYLEGLGGASGEKYSLLPPENATGNYVKVVQRIPIRLRFDRGQNSDHRLRPGMSVEPKIWLR